MIYMFISIFFVTGCRSYGFDAGSCGRQFRAPKMHRPPCDLTSGYCTSAGTAYPWHAVKRFVRENQGLMKRMYGDQSHGQVLREELEDFVIKDRKLYGKQDEFEEENELKETEPRLLREEFLNTDDFLNTKFVYSEDSFSVKMGELKAHFKSTTESPTTTNEEITDTTLETTTKMETTTLKEEKVETMLFQDVANEKNQHKVQVEYQMKGVNACPVKEEVVAPFWANNTRGEVLALLNMYPFEQYVHWEKCTHEHRQMYCRDGCRCEQQYRLHRLLAYDPNNECRGIFSDWFRFPSCCICKCYSIPPAEFRVTSRSPRAFDQNIPDWYMRKNQAIFTAPDHG